ncbi:hypothetical protein [Algoriphagus litoralis]|uniref:hypothetical protein n=1 Tax=Algoriphagus litoralis TaxID=2202829 RepID=UPI000DBA9711|nr:hypothetical protein [Algoriphagus litoralis]
MRRSLLQSFFVSFFLLQFSIVNAQEDLIPADSASFHSFLFLQEEIPNLSFRYFLPDTEDTASFSKQLGWSQTDSGLVSLPITDLAIAKVVEQNFIEMRVGYEVQYLVFSEVLSFGATREYVANLVNSSEFLVRTEEVTPSEDIVSLASYAHYTPLEKFKLRFISDFKLLIVTIIIVFFFVVALSMIAFMLVMKARKNRKEHLLKEYDRLIVDPLTSLLFEKELQEIFDLDQVSLNDYFPASMISKPIFREVLIERIIGLNKKMKGDFKEKLKALYRKLALDKQSIKSLTSRKWAQVAMGLVQINEMDLVEALPKVKAHTNSSNFHIRSLAVATVLNLSEKVDLAFLRDQTYPLSLWQQMNYLRIIRFVSHQKKLNLETLFQSSNPSIRIFGYRLVKTLGRVDLIEILSTLAENVSIVEKIEILEIYGALGAHMEVGFVNQCLSSENPTLILAAAKTAAVIGNTESIELLIELILLETNPRNKQVLMKSLHDLDSQRFEQLFVLDEDLEMTQIKNHILDPLLQHV